MSSEQTPNNELIASALKLPVHERVNLVNVMLDSIDEGVGQLSQSEVDQAWGDEISMRLQELESGEVKPVPSSEMWKKLGGKPNA